MKNLRTEEEIIKECSEVSKPAHSNSFKYSDREVKCMIETAQRDAWNKALDEAISKIKPDGNPLIARKAIEDLKVKEV